MDWIVSPFLHQIHLLQLQPLSVILCGDRICVEVIKTEWSWCGSNAIWLVSLEEEKVTRAILLLSLTWEGQWGHIEKVATYKPEEPFHQKPEEPFHQKPGLHVP